MSNMKKRIEFFDGKHFRETIIASARRIGQNRKHLNDINVFPVPDGDTGTNMVQTMETIAEHAESWDSDSFSQASDNIADSALNGARGNSGVILAQFFQGIADKARGKHRLKPDEFAEIVDDAVKNAHDSVSDPKEGTILTVMRDWATHLREKASHHTDFVSLFKEGLGRAKESLANTPKLLKELKNSNVVDAGAQGFVHILEGMLDFLEGRAVTVVASGTHTVDRVRHHTHSAEEAARFQYCTQCLVTGKDIDRDALKADLLPLGDSLIVIGSKRKARIHVHSNDPEMVFDRAAEYGDVSHTKVEDMRKQFDEKNNAKLGRIALVTDTSCDIPDELVEKYNITLIPMHLHVMGKEYIDRLELKPDDFYNLFDQAGSSISTSQPALSAFTSAFEDLSDTYESILAVHLPGAVSGTINGARLAAKSIRDKTRVEIVDGGAPTNALGLVVLAAAEMIRHNLELDEIVARLNSIVETSRLYASVPSLDHAVKMGRVPKSIGLLGKILNIKPVITFEQGKVAQHSKVIGYQKVINRVYELTAQTAQTFRNPRFAVAHVQNPELAEFYVQKLKNDFQADDVILWPASPALGAHAGKGTVAVSVVDFPVFDEE